MSTVIVRLNESDPTVTLHATRLKDGNPGAQLITVTGGLNALGQMNIGDVLFIIGHGSPTAFGGYSAASLAKLLATNDLHSGISIDLVGCKVGATGAPYALDLKLQLVANKIVPTSVTGGTNNMQVKADGTPFTKTPGPGGTEILAGKQTVNTPWGPRTRNINPKYGTS
jgi:hypothetical protein